MKIELLRTHTIEAVLKAATGLRIGAGRDAVEIGGIDNPIVKHPHTRRPYIPGSSLKGKLRSLMEWAMDKVEEDGAVWGSDRGKKYEADDPVLRIFGTTGDGWKGGPSRLMVRDALLDEEWVRDKVNRSLPLTEDKTEVTINRIEGKAARMGPRTMERVPAGALFHVEMLFKEFAVEGDGGRTDRRCLNHLIETLRLLEQDALGGSGSRGYGRVEVKGLRVDAKDKMEQFRRLGEFHRTAPEPFVEE